MGGDKLQPRLVTGLEHLRTTTGIAPRIVRVLKPLQHVNLRIPIEETLMQPLLEERNRIFENMDTGSSNHGQLPRDWRRVTVIAIKKCDKTDGTPESYRPIALTSIAWRIMEKMVLRRLTSHLHSHNLLPEKQYGFREGHSTTDQLLYFCQRIRNAHNKKSINLTVAVFWINPKLLTESGIVFLLSNCIKCLVLEEKPYLGFTIS
ncbi:putative RNA-directed DNA polymerase from transposon BS [Trichonephila clavipes]|nr:putative RNA-directed DNA polymerase from transposon BS [Trichonephila clavipes]